MRVIIADKIAKRNTVKLLVYPETRQTFNFDCGANALMSLLVYAGIEEREDRIAKLAGTTEKDGTGPDGVLRVLSYYGLPVLAMQKMRPAGIRERIDQGFPTIIAIQAYRESSEPYAKLWTEGHWVVAIGYDEHRIYFEDPSCFRRTWLADEELLERWHDDDRGKHRMRMQVS